MAIVDLYEKSIFKDLPTQPRQVQRPEPPDTQRRRRTRIANRTDLPDVIPITRESNLVDITNQREDSLYDRSAKTGANSEPFIEIKPNDPNRRFIGAESRLFPLRSTIRDATRLTRFLKSDRGQNFIPKQIFLQSLNPTLETKVYNPASLISSVPFVRINRHASFQSLSKIASILTTGALTNTLRTTGTITNYESSVRNMPPSGLGRVAFQQPGIPNDEKPGVQYARYGQDKMTTKQQWTYLNPNRYIFPINADTSGLPLSSRPSPKEEMNRNIRLAGDATRYTKSTGFNRPDFGQGSSGISIRSALTGVLRTLVPEPVRTPISRMLGLASRDVTKSEIKIANVYNPTFRYVRAADEGRGAIGSRVRTTDSTKTEIVEFEPGKSVITEMLDSIANVGQRKASTRVPFTFSTEGEIAERERANRPPISNQPSPDNRVKDYLQSYGEIKAKRTKKREGSLDDNNLPYEQQKIRDNTITYKAFGTDNAGAINEGSRFIDRVNALEPGQDYPDDVAGTKFNDIIPFKFFHINEGRFIIFRAYISGISETISPSWNTKKYIGRVDNVYLYTGAERTLSFNIDIHPHSAQELAPLWRKINALSGLCYPNYQELAGGGEYMVAPFVRLTIGDIYVNMPGIITSLGITFPDDSTWEIQRGEIDGNELARLPKHVQLSVGYTIIGKEKFSSTSKLFDPQFI